MPLTTHWACCLKAEMWGIVELMFVRMNSGPWASFVVNRFADKKPLCG